MSNNCSGCVRKGDRDSFVGIIRSEPREGSGSDEQDDWVSFKG